MNMLLVESVYTCPNPRLTFALTKFIWYQDQRILSANGTKRGWATWNETRELFRCVMKRWKKTKCGESRKKFHIYTAHDIGCWYRQNTHSSTHEKEKEREKKEQIAGQNSRLTVLCVHYWTILFNSRASHLSSWLWTSFRCYFTWEKSNTFFLTKRIYPCSSCSCCTNIFFLIWFIGLRCLKSSFQLFCLANRRSWAVRNSL